MGREMQEGIDSRLARSECDVACARSTLESIEIDLRDLCEWMGQRYNALEARFERKLEALEARPARKLER